MLKTNTCIPTARYQHTSKHIPRKLKYCRKAEQHILSAKQTVHLIMAKAETCSALQKIEERE
jgi:hypothetical protein